MCQITDGIKQDVTQLGNIILETLQENRELKSQNLMATLELESSTDVVYVVDMETNIILFVNSKTKQVFGEDIVGKVCYEVFQGLSQPCDFCTNDILLKQLGKPYSWIHFNPKNQIVYLVIDVAKESNGKLLRFERAIELKESELHSINKIIIKHHLI